MRVNPEIGAGHHSHCITAGPNQNLGFGKKTPLRLMQLLRRQELNVSAFICTLVQEFLKLNLMSLAVEKLLSIAKRVHDEVGIEFEFIDIGGGLGVPYKPEDKDFDLAEFSIKLLHRSRAKLLSMVLANRSYALNQEDTLFVTQAFY